jgi:hypothetical protein
MVLLSSLGSLVLGPPMIVDQWLSFSIFMSKEKDRLMFGPVIEDNPAQLLNMIKTWVASFTVCCICRGSWLQNIV